MFITSNHDCLSRWGTILYQVGIYFASPSSCRKLNYQKLWDKTSVYVTFFQTLQLIEVIHAALRLIPSSPFIALLQTGARTFVVWAIVIPYKEPKISIGLPFILSSWSIAEVLRYSYYALSTINKVPYFLTWCRYSLFLVLYWFGFSGEMILMYKALPMIKRKHPFSLKLPNPYNVSFYPDYFLSLVMLLYTPCKFLLFLNPPSSNLYLSPVFLKVYFHMVTQRGKILAKTSAKKTK